jgi:hypothetical protein
MPSVLENGPVTFEKGDKIYLVGPVQKIGTPTDEEIQRFAFGGEVKQEEERERTAAEHRKDLAPNPHIVWMSGQYVEADIPNGNGDQWTAEGLAISKLTPMLMPVTVMHNLRTAVGTIADVRLLTPTGHQVPRSKIDTTLALWGHRFPDVVEEALDNAEQGSLMQSMECLSPNYNCSVCGMRYHRLPYGVERENWCAHLTGESDQQGSRILGDVTFTGTGLIFGTRGAKGADPKAHLDVFQEQVAELHARFHHDTAKSGTASTRRVTRMETVEISKREHEQFTAAESERDELRTKLAEAERKQEEAEAAKATAETERDEAKSQLQQVTAERDETKLRDDRLAKLGKGFKAKLDKTETTKARVQEQAAKLSDEEWEARVTELEETLSVKRDDAGDSNENPGGGDPANNGGGGGNGSGEQTFSEGDVTASLAQIGNGNNGGGGQQGDRTQVKSVVGSLARSFAPEPAKKSS